MQRLDRNSFTTLYIGAWLATFLAGIGLVLSQRHHSPLEGDFG